MGRILLWILGAWATLDGIIMSLVILGAGRYRNWAAENAEQAEFLRQWSERKNPPGGR